MLFFFGFGVLNTSNATERRPERCWPSQPLLFRRARWTWSKETPDRGSDWSESVAFFLVWPPMTDFFFGPTWASSIKFLDHHDHSCIKQQAYCNCKNVFFGWVARQRRRQRRPLLGWGLEAMRQGLWEISSRPLKEEIKRLWEGRKTYVPTISNNWTSNHNPQI